MKHFASPDFWRHYRALPADVQQLADRCFALMNTDPRHPFICFDRNGTRNDVIKYGNESCTGPALTIQTVGDSHEQQLANNN